MVCSSQHDLESRHRYAGEYFIALTEFSSLDWPDLYSDYVCGKIAFPKTYALLSPSRYLELGVNQEAICGKRSFYLAPERTVEVCQASVIWGYECRNNGRGTVHADHLFPFSRGGITDPRNQIFLCGQHNSAKGSDFHCYPWERGEQEWVREVIERINSAIKNCF